MLPKLFVCLSMFLAAFSATPTTEPNKPILCDLSRRTESCPQGYCCARDEFLPEYVICKKYGKIRSSCATVDDVSVCPCEKGLKCIPNVNSATFVSIYGKCQPTSVPTTNTTAVESTTTTAPTTRIIPKTTVKRNTPPLIHLHQKVAKIYRFSDSGQKVTSFTVVDNDSGKNGDVQCSVLQSPYFAINKVDRKTFEVVLASSLRSLSPQIIPNFIICEDSGSPKLNGVAQVSIQIVDKTPVHISPSTVGTPLESITMELKSSIESITFTTDMVLATYTKALDMTSSPLHLSTSMVHRSTDIIATLSLVKDESSIMSFSSNEQNEASMIIE